MFDTYKHLYNFEKTFANKDDPCSGILVCIRKTEEIVSTEEIVKGRLMHIKTRNKASNEIVNIFSIYCHSNNSKKQKELIEKLNGKIMLQQPKLENLLILGDFNFVTSILDRNSQKLNNVDLETNKTWGSFENQSHIQD